MLKKTSRLLSAAAVAIALAVPVAPPAFAQETRLHHAAKHSPQRVREMLPQREVNAQTPQGDTALHWALDPTANLTPEARAEIVRLLLEAEASPFILNNKSVSSLHLAARGWNPAHELILRRVAELGGSAGNPDVKDRNQETPLHWAMDPESAAPHADRVRIVEKLLAAGANPGARAGAGFTPAHLAARRSAEALRMMLNAAWDFDINGRADGGGAPLHWAVGGDSAVENGTVEDIARLLMEHGADPTLLDDNGDSPLELARRFNRGAEVIALLSEEEDDAETRLIREIKRLSRGEAPDDSEILRLIDAGVNVNRPSPNRVPALHWAATFGQTRVVRRLVGAGIDVNRRNPNGNGTAAHLAALLQNAEMLAALVELGADLSLRNASGHAPLCQPTLNADKRANLALNLINSADNVADRTRRMVHALSVCAG